MAAWGATAGGAGRTVRRCLLVIALPFVAALALGACGGSSHHAAAQKSTASFSDLIGAGSVLLNKDNPAAAIQVFQQAIAKEPKNPVGYYDVGVAYAQEGNRKGSLTGYAEALSKNKNYVPALYNYGVAFEQTRPSLAIYFFRRVIKLQHDAPTALLNLGRLVYAQTVAASAHSDAAQARARAVDRTRALRAMKLATVLEPSLIADVPASLRAKVRATKLPKHKPKQPPKPKHAAHR